MSSVRRAGEGGGLWQGPSTGEHLIHPATRILILYLRREQEWCSLIAVRERRIPVHLHSLEDFVADNDVFDLHAVDR